MFMEILKLFLNKYLLQYIIYLSPLHSPLITLNIQWMEKMLLIIQFMNDLIVHIDRALNELLKYHSPTR